MLVKGYEIYSGGGDRRQLKERRSRQSPPDRCFRDFEVWWVSSILKPSFL